MIFVTGHFINHALALISLDMVIAGQAVFKEIWQSPPGTLLLYGALFLHLGFTIFGLYKRRRLRMPLWEMIQIALGVAIPFWLFQHIIGTRGIDEVFGVESSYWRQFARIWANDPSGQIVMLLLVWTHGCVGLHFWLRIRPWYRSLTPALFVIALLLPAAAIGGFAMGGREVQVIMAYDPAWLERVAAEENWPGPAERVFASTTRQWVISAFIAALALVIGARLLRRSFERKTGRLELHYLDGAKVAIKPGMTVLDGSRAANIPHASACGGRGRCSTCRIHVGKGAEYLPPPDANEMKVLLRIGAGDGIRLACQLRPTKDLEVAPLLPAISGPYASQAQVNPSAGIEREVAVMFADLRAFTRMSEGQLPFDIVFILNQYFKAMGAAIEHSGGRVDKFIGDGIMALFGIDAEPALASRQALIAAKAMAENLADLNRDIRVDLQEPLRIGIGLHVGPVILGEMGYGRATSLTAIGDVVNVASRLEALTKEFGAELVVSASLAKRAGVELADADAHNIDIRGRRRPLRVHVIHEAASLPALGVDDDQRMPKPSSLFPGWLDLPLMGKKQT